MFRYPVQHPVHTIYIYMNIYIIYLFFAKAIRSYDNWALSRKSYFRHLALYGLDCTHSWKWIHLESEQRSSCFDLELLINKPHKKQVKRQSKGKVSIAHTTGFRERPSGAMYNWTICLVIVHEMMSRNTEYNWSQSSRNGGIVTPRPQVYKPEDLTSS